MEQVASVKGGFRWLRREEQLGAGPGVAAQHQEAGRWLAEWVPCVGNK